MKTKVVLLYTSDLQYIKQDPFIWHKHCRIQRCKNHKLKTF